MRLLIDTNVFLWMAFAPRSMSRLARETVSDLANELVVSVVTPIEIGTSVGKGKLALGQPITDFYMAHMRALGRTSELPFTVQHSLVAADLPYTHRDPMDRILAAQAIVEGIPVVSNDTKIRDLGATLIW